MKKVLLMSIIFILILLPTLCYADYDGIKIRKDPVLAGALSWYVPGLGQLYAGAFLKGAAFWVAEETLIVATILTFAELSPSVSGDINLGLNIMSKENPNKSEQRNAIIFGATLVVVHFINIIDAVNTTINYNKSNEKDFYPSLELDEQKKMSIGINRKF